MPFQFSSQAWNEYLYWQSTDKKMVKRINTLLEDIIRGGHEGKGKPEPLKGDLSGYWSRRIDDKNRLVYRVEDEICIIIQCKGHYND